MGSSRPDGPSRRPNQPHPRNPPRRNPDPHRVPEQRRNPDPGRRPLGPQSRNPEPGRRDVYTGTARPECFPLHKAMSQDFVRKLYRNGMLEKRSSRQWYDPKLERFLPDRYVRGKCPNPKCDNESAYSDECDKCGHQHDPSELINPRSALSDATPVMRDTVHWFLDMWKVAETLRVWIEGKSGSWRQSVLSEVLGRVLPGVRFAGDREAAYKELRATLPPHKMKYTAGKNIATAEVATGVKHHVALSVVGTERLLASGYFRAKLAQEAKIKSTPVPYTILHATQFFEFLRGIAQSGAEGGKVRLSHSLSSPWRRTTSRRRWPTRRWRRR